MELLILVWMYMYNPTVKLPHNKCILSLSYVHNKNIYIKHCCKYQNVLSHWRIAICAFSMLPTSCPQGGAAFRRSTPITHWHGEQIAPSCGQKLSYFVGQKGRTSCSAPSGATWRICYKLIPQKMCVLFLNYA